MFEPMYLVEENRDDNRLYNAKIFAILKTDENKCVFLGKLLIDNDCYVSEFNVNEKFRNRKIGTGIMSTLIENFGHMFLHLRVGGGSDENPNRLSHNQLFEFYSKFGFVRRENLSGDSDRMYRLPTLKGNM